MISANPWRQHDSEIALATSMLIKSGVLHPNSKPLGRPKTGVVIQKASRPVVKTIADQRRAKMHEIMNSQVLDGMKTTQQWLDILHQSGFRQTTARELYDSLRSLQLQGKVIFTKQPKILGGWTMWQSKG